MNNQNEFQLHDNNDNKGPPFHGSQHTGSACDDFDFGTAAFTDTAAESSRRDGLMMTTINADFDWAADEGVPPADNGEPFEKPPASAAEEEDGFSLSFPNETSAISQEEESPQSLPAATPPVAFATPTPDALLGASRANTAAGQSTNHASSNSFNFYEDMLTAARGGDGGSVSMPSSSCADLAMDLYTSDDTPVNEAFVIRRFHEARQWKQLLAQNDELLAHIQRKKMALIAKRLEFVAASDAIHAEIIQRDASLFYQIQREVVDAAYQRQVRNNDQLALETQQGDYDEEDEDDDAGENDDLFFGRGDGALTPSAFHNTADILKAKKLRDETSWRQSLEEGGKQRSKTKASAAQPRGGTAVSLIGSGGGPPRPSRAALLAASQGVSTALRETECEYGETRVAIKTNYIRDPFTWYHRDPPLSREGMEALALERMFPRPCYTSRTRKVHWTPQAEQMLSLLVACLELDRGDGDGVGGKGVKRAAHRRLDGDDSSTSEDVMNSSHAQQQQRAVFLSGFPEATVRDFELLKGQPRDVRWQYVRNLLEGLGVQEGGLGTYVKPNPHDDTCIAPIAFRTYIPLSPLEVECHYFNVVKAPRSANCHDFTPEEDKVLYDCMTAVNKASGAAAFVGYTQPFTSSDGTVNGRTHPRVNPWLEVAARLDGRSPFVCIQRFQQHINADFINRRLTQTSEARQALDRVVEIIGTASHLAVTELCNAILDRLYEREIQLSSRRAVQAMKQRDHDRSRSLLNPQLDADNIGGGEYAASSPLFLTTNSSGGPAYFSSQHQQQQPYSNESGGSGHSPAVDDPAHPPSGSSRNASISENVLAQMLASRRSTTTNTNYAIESKSISGDHSTSTEQPSPQPTALPRHLTGAALSTPCAFRTTGFISVDAVRIHLFKQREKLDRIRPHTCTRSPTANGDGATSGSSDLLATSVSSVGNADEGGDEGEEVTVRQLGGLYTPKAQWLAVFAISVTECLKGSVLVAHRRQFAYRAYVQCLLELKRRRAGGAYGETVPPTTRCSSAAASSAMAAPLCSAYGDVIACALSTNKREVLSRRHFAQLCVVIAAQTARIDDWLRMPQLDVVAALKEGAVRPQRVKGPPRTRKLERQRDSQRAHQPLLLENGLPASVPNRYRPPQIKASEHQQQQGADHNNNGAVSCLLNKAPTGRAPAYPSSKITLSLGALPSRSGSTATALHFSNNTSTRHANVNPATGASHAVSLSGNATPTF